MNEITVKTDFCDDMRNNQRKKVSLYGTIFGPRSSTTLSK